MIKKNRRMEKGPMLHTVLMITFDQVDWFADKGKSFASETWPAHSPFCLWALSYVATGYDGTALTLDLVSNSEAVKSLICWSRNFLPFMEAEG